MFLKQIPLKISVVFLKIRVYFIDKNVTKEVEEGNHSSVVSRQAAALSPHTLTFQTI